MLAVVLLVVCAPASVVLGVLARRRIARTGERGRALATTGIAVGMVLTALGAVLVVIAVSSGAVTVRAGVVPAVSAAPAVPAVPVPTVPAPTMPAAPAATAAPVAPAGPAVPGSAIASTMEEQSGGRATGVTCRDDLLQRIGASITCTATIDGRPGLLSATVTSIDTDDTVNFDIERVAPA